MPADNHLKKKTNMLPDERLWETLRAQFAIQHSSTSQLGRHKHGLVAGCCHLTHVPMSNFTHKHTHTHAQVNIKLSIKLSLPQQLQDPEGLIAKARTWLQSAALDKMLQQHGLHIGTGSPAHLVTLMSSPGGEGSRYYHGVDEVLEVYGSSDSTSDSPPDPASTSSSRSPSHPQLQAEMGPGHRHSASTGGVYSHTMALPEASSMSAWGRLQPPELKPLVLGQQPQASTLAGAAAAAQHGAAGSDGGHATSSAEEDEIGRRTVLGAIVGAVLGSAAAGAGLAMAIATAVRRRRAGQQQSGGGSAGGCCNSAAPASCDGDAARSRVSVGFRNQSCRRLCWCRCLVLLSGNQACPPVLGQPTNIANSLALHVVDGRCTDHHHTNV